jgi:acetyl-CoA carboxylase biotin carboxyl carrier protein
MVTAGLTVPYRPRVPIGAVAARHAVDIVRRNTRSGGGVAQVEAHITGTVWKIEVAVGDTVEEGDTVVILESMKMEMPVEAEDEGTVSAILVEEGQSVSEGDTLVELA